MYNRVVTGIIRQQEHAIHTQSLSRSLDSLYENRACIANIQRTRYVDPDDYISGRQRAQSVAEEDAAVVNTNAHESETQDNSFLAPTMPSFQDEDQVFALDL